MEEGTSNKAIPLRRSRATARPVVVKSSDGFVIATARRVLAPPRQLWLATLGSAGIGVQNTRAAWARLIAEGEAVEGRLRRLLRLV
jgi:hypothetical protein